MRAGILSVPAGQIEAAYAMGLSRLRTLFDVVLPQAFRVALPALGNEFSSVIKDTSLLSAISAIELSFIGGVLVNGALSIDFNLIFIIWTEIALLYFVLTYVVVRIVRFVENRSKVPGLRPPNYGSSREYPQVVRRSSCPSWNRPGGHERRGLVHHRAIWLGQVDLLAMSKPARDSG